jgi:iron complex outermembrane receptor protein
MSMLAVAGFAWSAVSDSVAAETTSEAASLDAAASNAVSAGPAANADAQATPAASAPSEGSLETIVVTAQKRSENLQNVPISIAAVTAQTIEEAHTVNLEALTGAIPDVQIGHFSNTPTSAVFSIRGMSVIDPDPYAGQTVTVVVDGVPLFYNIMSLPDLFDIERIEILRGPQGTLFGANTIGGVVNIITEQPTGEFSGKANASVGNYNRLDANVSLNFPIISDVLAGKVSLLHHGEDGYVTNIVDGSSMGNQNDSDARVYLKWTPNDKFDATLIQEYDQLRDGGPIVVNGAVPGEAEYVAPGTQLPGDALPQYPSPCVPITLPCRAPSTYYSADSSVPDKEYEDIYSTTLTMNFDSEIGKWVSITGYKRFRDDNYTDQDGTVEFLDATHRITSGYQATEEVRDDIHFTSNIELQVGTFLSYDHYLHEQNYEIQFAAPGFSQITLQNESSRSESVFAQTYISLTDKLRFQAGLRGTDEHTMMTAGIENFISPSGIAVFSGAEPIPGGFTAIGKRTWNNVGGKTGFDYKWTDDLLTYLYYARGFKSGGFVGRLALPTDIGPYNPEYVDTIELGLKGDWLDRRLRTNVAIFYNKYHDLQLAEIYFVKNSTGQTVNGNSIVNAAQAKTQGVEFEVTAVPTDALKINASLARLYAKYTNFPYANPDNGGKVEDLDGYDLQDAPHWTASGGVRYSIPAGPGKAVVGVQDRYTSQFYDYNLDDSPRSTVQSTNYIDGTLDWDPPGNRWGAGLWVRNIADRHYIASVYDAPRTFGLVSYAPPREFGATVHYNW